MLKQPAKRPHAPQLLPSPNDDDHHPRVPSRRARSAEPTRRKVSSAALNAPPSVPCLLAAKTSTLVVSSDANFVKSTTMILAQMGVNVLGRSNVGDALCALEEDIAEHGCITFDQILCEAEDAGDAEGEEGAETLLAELKSTSWPASVVFVSSAWPTASVLQQHAAHGARAVVRKPVNAAELSRLFTHLKRRPHEQLFEQGRGVELVPRPPRSKPALTLCCSEIPAALGARSTPLHITAMGVGLVTFLHVHAGRQKGGGSAQTFEEAGAFECETMPGVEGVNPEWIYRFVVIVMVNLQLDEELLVTAVILLERACRVADLILTESNWQSVLLAAIIVAAKTHYDESVWLGDFVDRLRMYPLETSYLHEIEMAFLRALRFCVIVRPSSFFRYAAEIANLHDTYCPYASSMSCGLAYRMGARKSAAWPPQTSLSNSTKAPAAVCAPCSE